MAVFFMMVDVFCCRTGALRSFSLGRLAKWARLESGPRGLYSAVCCRHSFAPDSKLAERGHRNLKISPEAAL